MRIALVITELYPGGAENCLVNLACFLKDHGHEAAVWQLWPPPPPDKNGLVELLDQHNIPWRSGGAVRAWHFPATIHWLTRELRDFQPDIVQSFLFHANVAAAVAARRLHCKFFGGARVRQPEQVRQWLEYWAARRMKKLICVSQSVARHCQTKEKIPSKKIVVIPNGIKLIPVSTGEWKSHRWEQLGLPADARVLLFVGRLCEQKGVIQLLQHAAALLESLPEHHLVLMGDGELNARLRELRASCGQSGRIHLVGWQPAAIDWMRICQILILPAKYEGMPNAVMEAMAVGKPVISFEVDGVRELFGESTLANAQIVTAQNFNEFNEAILTMACSQELRRRCGKYNRQRIEQNYLLEQQLARYLALYEQCTGDSSASEPP